MLRHWKNILVCTFVFIPSIVCCQVVARVAGLESNKEYMTLLQQDKRLHAVEDSVQKVITETRRLFAADSGNSDKREQYRNEIIRLEKELFEVRDSVGIVSSKINRIEQDFILNNMGKTAVVITETSAADSQNQKKNLVYNSYFKENLGTQDYETLIRSQQKEVEVQKIIDKYIQNYDTLVALSNSYAVETDKNIAFDTYSKYKTLTAVNKRMEDSLASAWGYVYDNKTYCYNLLLDKMNRSDLLSDFENNLQNIREQVASAADSVESTVLFAYPLQKRMVLAYEKSLADILNNKAAADSS